MARKKLSLADWFGMAILVVGTLMLFVGLPWTCVVDSKCARRCEPMKSVQTRQSWWSPCRCQVAPEVPAVWVEAEALDR